MKTRVTKKDIETLTNLIKEHGYWSEQVKEFNGSFEYRAMVRLQEKVKYGKVEL